MFLAWIKHMRCLCVRYAPNISFPSSNPVSITRLNHLYQHNPTTSSLFLSYPCLPLLTLTVRKPLPSLLLPLLRFFQPLTSLPPLQKAYVLSLAVPFGCTDEEDFECQCEHEQEIMTAGQNDMRNFPQNCDMWATLEASRNVCVCEREKGLVKTKTAGSGSGLMGALSGLLGG